MLGKFTTAKVGALTSTPTDSVRRRSSVLSKPLLQINEAVFIEDILKDPLQCSYLYSFAQVAKCAHIVLFWIVVDIFKDLCKRTNFRNMEEVNVAASYSVYIWKEFLSFRATNEVVIGLEAKQVTVERIANVSRHRDRVFDLAVEDPLKFLSSDVLSQFLKAPQYREAMQKQSLISQFNDFVLFSPTENTITQATWKLKGGKLELDDIAQDIFFFEAFMQFLEKRFCVENLMCYREILVFEELSTEKGNVIESRDYAWRIILNFFLPGAKNEVSISSWRLKEILLQVAFAPETMFSDVKQTLKKALDSDCQCYHKSPFILEALHKVKKKSKKSLFDDFKGLFTRRN